MPLMHWRLPGTGKESGLPRPDIAKHLNTQTMKKTILSIALLITVFNSCQGQGQDIYLVVRADDMGFSHSANLACIDVLKNGIGTSVEIMVPAPWFPEAVKLLEENKDFDVGIHLATTSEWENLKWRPVAHVPSLVDEDGYFYPTFWAGENFTKEQTMTHNNWTLVDVEKELRAQIELALKKLPRITHMNYHMGGTGVDPKIKEIFENLAKEYGLMSGLEEFDVKRFPRVDNSGDLEQRIKSLIKNLEELEPGVWLYVDHPAYNTPELQAIGHKGYLGVAKDRDGVTKSWSNSEVRKVIERRGIKLVSYKDLRDMKK